MPAGFRVLKRRRTVDAAWIDKFRRIPVANISDSMFRLSAGGDVTNSIIGERMLAYCQAKGFGGIVIHGAAWRSSRAT